MVPARSYPARQAAPQPVSQPPRVSQQRTLAQRTVQVRRALRDQQRTVAQRRVVQQRRGVQQQRAQQRGVELQRQLELLSRQQQRLRVWQRTAAKRAARQIETEQAILEREERLRAYRRERETYEGYVRRRHAGARLATAAVNERTLALDTLLRTALSTPLDVGFATLKRRPPVEPFDSGGLDVPFAVPRPDAFAPGANHVPSWIPGQREARERGREAAEAAYEQALADYRAAEFDRVRRLSVAKLHHQRRQTAIAEQARVYNAAVDRLRDGYLARSRGAVERYARLVLSSRDWPAGVRLAWRLRYRPDLRQLDAECVLPGPEVVPTVRRYRYVAAVDALRRQVIPATEINARYAGFVAQAALCALADLFQVLAADIVDVVQLNARAPAGVHPSRPHLVSLAVTRAEWAGMRPSVGDPQAMLLRLDARVSPDPTHGAPVLPWADFDVE